MNFHTGNVGDHLALLKVWLVCNQQLEKKNSLAVCHVLFGSLTKA
jgi:hypothetical protein